MPVSASYEIELSEPSTSYCDCCQGLTTRLTRFVYRGGDAFGVYFATYSNNHPDQEIAMLISLGEWGEESSPAGRASFFCKVRPHEGSYQVMLGDAATSPWGHAEVVGQKLSREEALAHPDKRVAFDVLDEAFLRDLSLKGYLDRIACGSAAAPLEHNFGMPDDLFELGPELEGRAKVDRNLASLDGRRFFVRCMLPVPVEHYGPWTVGLWIEISRPDFESVVKAWNDPVEWEHLKCSGTVANDGQGLDLPIPLGATVRIHAPHRDEPPYVLSTDSAELSDLLSRTWPRASFEAYAVSRGML